MPKANNNIKKIIMKKVSNSKKREILSFEKKAISGMRLEKVQGGYSTLLWSSGGVDDFPLGG